MYVKRLRLAGFKSFAEPTALEFEPGVNVIVGPNGSGKSNIADGLAWVLGSQAPSALRGAAMEDVIFAGASGRPALASADVELTLDNSNRVLPLDLSEVTISRSVDRSGAAEYRINGAACRLLDITELLSDTGMGRSLHTVVGQGQLDAVLHARPEDRRAFIEEASQIGKYRRRKDRSLRKIERVDDNLLRLNDVLSELRRSLRPLKRQAGAASQYSELADEQRSLRQRLTAHEARELERLADEATAGSGAAELRLLSDELANVRARLGSAEQERRKFAAAADGAATVAHGLARVSDRLRALARLASERAATISARLAAETEEGYRERIRLLGIERDRWSTEVQVLEGNATDLRRLADASQVELEAALMVEERAEARLETERAAETSAAETLVRAEGSEAAGQATLRSAEARVNSVRERREVRGRELLVDDDAVQRAEREVEDIEADLDRVTEAAAAAEVTLESARERAEALRAQLGDSHAGNAAAHARVEALEQAQEVVREFPGAVSRIQPLLGEARERAAVAADDEDEASLIVKAADQEVERLWGNVARHDEELRRLDALLAGAAERLAGARRRREAREVELAALDEELARGQEALAGAERAITEERAALPGHRAALDRARTRRERADQEVAAARRDRARVEASQRDADLEARAAEERVLAARLRLEEAEAGIGDARRALEGLADLRRTLEDAFTRAERVAGAALLAAEGGDLWTAEADERAVAASRRSREGDEQVMRLVDRERDLARRTEQATRLRNEAEVRGAEARARLTALAERAMEEWGLTLVDLLDAEGLDPDEIEAARARVDQLDRQIRRMGVINPRAAEEFAELAEREQFLVQQMEDLRSSRTDLMKVVKEVDETIVRAFAAAYADVAREFEEVFERLFPGGRGRLTLTHPDDLLVSGIDVEARPAGKNVKKLSLLSGGERSLVALAFLFAIFRSRPSPFYLLDEVEAALDDVNLQRFISLVAELEERAQILIVTHQKRTMEAADVLYGVSMAKDGVTQVVAKRLERQPVGDSSY